MLTVIFLIAVVQHLASAQPGPYSGKLLFRVFNDGKIVDLNAIGWKVNPAVEDKHFESVAYTYPGYYIIKPLRSPVGAKLKEDFHVEIIHFKDTMKVFMPSLDYKEVKIDSIPFARGVYHIPQHVYDLKSLVNSYKAGTFTPSLNGDWSLFSKKVYECYLEKVQDIQFDYFADDYYHNYTKLQFMFKLNYHDKSDYHEYHYLGNTVIYNNDNQHHKIYLVREISDTTFWGSKIYKTQVCFLYAQKNQIYAIASRQFEAYTGVVSEFGIYKLHFYDIPIAKGEQHHLESLLNKDIFQSVLKTKEKGNDYNNSSFLPKLTKLYNKLSLK